MTCFIGRDEFLICVVLFRNVDINSLSRLYLFRPSVQGFKTGVGNAPLKGFLETWGHFLVVTMGKVALLAFSVWGPRMLTIPQCPGGCTQKKV